MKKYLIPLLLSLLLLLSACNAASVTDKLQSTVEELKPVPTVQVNAGVTAVTPVPTAVITPEPTAAPAAVAILDADNYAQAGDYTDSVGNSYHYSYHLPVVTGDSGYIGAVNVEIDGIYNNFIVPELENMKNSCSLVTLSVSWRCAEYNGITSLIILVRNDWGCDSYYVYNFKTVDGKMASNGDIFAALGITGTAFTTAAGDAMSEYLSFDGVTDPDDTMMAQMNDVRYKSLNEGNIHEKLPIYVTEEGIICYVGRAYSLAGADYYDHLFILVPEGGFSDDALCRLSLDYYESLYGSRPGFAACDSTNEDAIVIQLYDSLDDHNSTADWYTLNRNGAGTNTVGTAVNITVQ